MKYKDIKTPEQLYEFMKYNIKYGFLSTYDNKTHRRVDMNDDALYERLLFTTYYLQHPSELLFYKHGICYDQVEFERQWFKENGYEVKTYFTPFHNHSFLVFVDDRGYNLFERTIKEYNGIHTKESLEEILNYYKQIQLSKTNLTDLSLYPYEEVEFGCNFYEFINNVTGEDELGTALKLKLEKKKNN